MRNMLLNTRSATLLLVWGLAVGVHAQNTNRTAASASFADVAEVVAMAQTGDIVNIPAGNAVWTSSLLLTNGITLRGAGTNATRIIRTNGGPAITVKLAATSPVRVTGISFRGDWNNPIVKLNGSGVSDAGATLTSFRVDRCNFTLGGRAVYPRGWCYGVIDHCAFTNSNIGVGLTGDNTLAWGRAIEPGSTNSVYIEDNLFVVNNDAPAEPNEQIYHQEGARSVTRFNVFDGTANTSRNTCLYDSHGNWGGGGTDPDSEAALTYCAQPLIEVYSNTFAIHHSYHVVGIRGGSMLIYSNVFTYVATIGSKIKLTEEEGWSSTLFSPLRNTWPARQQISNSFFWANSINGASLNEIQLGQMSDATFIQQDRDYWLQSPNSTNGSPPGVYASYRPLTYPHPRVKAEDEAGSSTNLMAVTPPSLDFGRVAVAAFKELAFRVENTGSGVFSGNASVAPPFSIVSGSPYSLAPGQSREVVIRFSPTVAGEASHVVSFIGAGETNRLVSGSAMFVLPTLSFDATAGVVTTPFSSNADNTISQSVATDDPSSGGRAVYGFNIPNAGYYIVSADVYAPDDGANSFFADIDAEPASNMIWDIPAFSGWQSQSVRRRGTSPTLQGSPYPQQWLLDAGPHQLIIRGREPGAKLGRIKISVIAPPLSRPRTN